HRGSGQPDGRGSPEAPHRHRLAPHRPAIPLRRPQRRDPPHPDEEGPSLPGVRSSMSASERLERYMHAHIPLVAQMQVKVASADAAGLRLTAPLAPNINHERTAFGGSLA